MSDCPHCGQATWIEGVGCEFGCHERAEMVNRIEALEAENLRLREALEKVEVSEFCAAPPSQEAIKVRNIARAALQDKGET